MAFADWSTNPASNSLVDGITWSNGMLPSQVDDSARQMMADLATWRLAPAFGGDLNLGAFTVRAAYVIASTALASDSGSNGYINLIPGSSSASGQIQIFGPDRARRAFIYQPSSGIGANTLLFAKDDGNGFTFAGGEVRVHGPNTTESGQISFRLSNGTRRAFMYVPGAGSSPNSLHIGSDTGGGVVVDGPMGVANALVVGAGIAAGGDSSVVGNFSATFLKADPNAYFTVSGSDVFLNLDNGAYLKFSRTTRRLYFNPGTGECVSFASDGIRTTGNVIANTSV